MTEWLTEQNRGTKSSRGQQHHRDRPEHGTSLDVVVSLIIELQPRETLHERGNSMKILTSDD